MREICTSGTVRGEGGNILTYSAQAVPAARPMVGFAALNPPYETSIRNALQELA